MKKAFIFDLDGTVADTADSIAHFVNRATAAFGLSSISREKVCVYAGDGAVKLIERTLQDVGGSENFEELFDYYIQLYHANPYHALRPFEGIVPTLSALKEKGVRLAVLSNKPHDAVVPICRHLFGDLFDYVQGQKEDVPVKPDPTGLAMITKSLGVTPAECVYVGDTDVDMLTGKRGNMLTVGVLWGFRDEKELRDSGADVIIAKPEELTALL